MLKITALTLLMAVYLSEVSAKAFWKKGDLSIGYDFEQATDLENIGRGLHELSLSSLWKKHGRKSLKWRWKVMRTLRVDLSPQLVDSAGNRRKACGVHFWMHQRKALKTKMKVILEGANGMRFSFRLNMNFVNWRAVARSIRISQTKSLSSVNKISFEMEYLDPFTRSGDLHIDLLRIATRCVGWSYDAVNPPQIPMNLGMKNAIGGLEDLNGVYESNHFWQMTYKWSKIDRYAWSKIDTETPLSQSEDKLTKQFVKIEERIDNWYFAEQKSFFSLDEFSRNRMLSLLECQRISQKNRKFRNKLERIVNGNLPVKRLKYFFSRGRYDGSCIATAYLLYNKIQTNRMHLFPSRDILPYGKLDWSGMKFNEVVHGILFPLALEHFISKSKGQRGRSLNKGRQSREKMREVLREELRNEPSLLRTINSTKTIDKAFNSIDDRRMDRLKGLFAYLEEEGWDEGSGLGNTDHLLNLNEGYAQSVYLLRRPLKHYDDPLLKKYLRTARWYTEIGEIHQERHPFKGTTADKAKNLIGRLLVILASPHETAAEARQKIQDAFALKGWIENALDINEGYAGIVKPDFTGYHHKGAYFSAYTPEALHSITLAAYYLHGTDFAISRKHLQNLKEALKNIYLVSGSFALPLSLSGAKQGNAAGTLINLLPAFAYIASALDENSGANVDPEMGSLFLRLYDKRNPYVQLGLWDGKAHHTARYLNSIGSIAVLDQIASLAKQQGLQAAKNSQGHRTLNYAGASVHRRKDWTITVKGFGQYTWDFESFVDQNVYGRYLSHGHLQITDNRRALLDIMRGWDWNRIPGTTTVELKLDELESLGKSRYFTNCTSVGGVVYSQLENDEMEASRINFGKEIERREGSRTNSGTYGKKIVENTEKRERSHGAVYFTSQATTDLPEIKNSLMSKLKWRQILKNHRQENMTRTDMGGAGNVHLNLVPMGPGTLNYDQGAFMMDFHQPRYRSKFFQQNPFEFSFRKSFFFNDELVVCLGSDVRKQGLKDRHVVTTLFQEKLQNDAEIYFDNRKFTKKDSPLTAEKRGSATIMDSQGNGYVIRGVGVQLRIGVNKETRKPNGETVFAPKVYASAVIEHGSEPLAGKYEYAILIGAERKKVALFSRQNNRYKVLQHDSLAHVVQFNKQGKSPVSVYNIFNKNFHRQQGALHSVDRPSSLAISENHRYIVVNVMDPDLRRFTEDETITNSKDIRHEVLYKSKSKMAFTLITFNARVKLTSHTCPGNENVSVSEIFQRVTKEGEIKSSIRLGLSHGSTCELRLEKL